MPGAQCTRSLVCDENKHTSVVTTVTPEIARHSPRNGFNAYIVLSPVTGLSCHRRYVGIASRKLDASVGASGPHDFAVREPAPSSLAPPASTASRSQRP